MTTEPRERMALVQRLEQSRARQAAIYVRPPMPRVVPRAWWTRIDWPAVAVFLGVSAGWAALVWAVVAAARAWGL